MVSHHGVTKFSKARLIGLLDCSC